MRAWRHALRWAGSFLLTTLMVSSGIAAKGRVEARARVVHTQAAQAAARVLQREAYRPADDPEASSVTHTVGGAEFRVHRPEDEGMTTVVLEWVDS
jgi:hypothetical protein